MQQCVICPREACSYVSYQDAACVPTAQTFWLIFSFCLILGCVPNSSKPRTVSICITLQQFFEEVQVHDSEQLHVSDGGAHVLVYMLTAETFPVLQPATGR